MSAITRFNAARRSEGLWSALAGAQQVILTPVYQRTLRRLTPPKLGVFSGVVARDPPPVEWSPSSLARHWRAVVHTLASGRPHVAPDIETPAVTALDAHVRRDDAVVVVGGGRGVTATVAARLVGPEGMVTAYEAAPEKARVVRETVALNAVADRVSVVEAAVGAPRSVWGPSTAAETVAPADLPACDVLELDCEGSEVEILDALQCRPRVIVVETHWVADAHDNEVAARLADLGYTVVDVAVENEASGCYVLTAVSGR